MPLSLWRLCILISGFKKQVMKFPSLRRAKRNCTLWFTISSRATILTEKPGYSWDADLAFAEVQPAAYVALVIPGGRAPEYIRNDPNCLRIIQHFFMQEKPVAQLCHGPLALAAAGVLKGRRTAAYPALEPDVKAAGGEFIDLRSESECSWSIKTSPLLRGKRLRWLPMIIRNKTCLTGQNTIEIFWSDTALRDWHTGQNSRGRTRAEDRQAGKWSTR
jgi:PfpI family intracellular protease